ncbi:MAG TPA: hypothetical protein VIH37_08070, partial [Candidatus Limnocylindrales bacterium]
MRGSYSAGGTLLQEREGAVAINDVSPLTGDGGRLSGACSAPRDPPVRAGAELTGGGSVLRVDVRARRGPMLDVVIGGVEATVEVGEPSTRVQAGDRPAVLVRP